MNDIDNEKTSLEVKFKECYERNIELEKENKDMNDFTFKVN